MSGYETKLLESFLLVVQLALTFARDHESRKSVSLDVLPWVYFKSCNILGTNKPSRGSTCIDTTASYSSALDEEAEMIDGH